MKKQRYRILFSKLKQMRYTGHLDLILTWERVFRRGSIPLAYSEGYSPRPLLNLAAPLPLGYISTGEIGDFWLSEPISKSKVELVLKGVLPPGLAIKSIQEIPDLYGPKLPSLVTAASYSVSLPGTINTLSNKVESLIASSTIKQERKGKTFDLRPLIKQLELKPSERQTQEDLHMTLVTMPGATGRPDSVLKALEIETAKCLICRTKIELQGTEA